MTRFLAVLFATAVAIVAASAGSASPGAPTFTISPAPAYVGDYVTGSGCGYQPSHWYEIDTYGPNTTVDGPLVSSSSTRADDTGCLNVPLLSPARAAGAFSTYVFACSAKGSGNGCGYGSGGKLIVDVDFEVLSAP
jgi:hypothetical protein